MIYVDKIVQQPKVIRGRWKNSCHLIADSKEELIEFAKKIGLPLEWFRAHRIKYLQHFDLSEKWRKIAIENGAVEWDSKRIVKKLMDVHKEKTGKKY